MQYKNEVILVGVCCIHVTLVVFKYINKNRKVKIKIKIKIIDNSSIIYVNNHNVVGDNITRHMKIYAVILTCAIIFTIIVTI